jgi:pyridoxamine 5'-phosphate oxidase
MQDIQNIRKEYILFELDEAGIYTDPFKQFGDWFKDALNSVNPYPNAMILSTISAEMRSSSRVVLLKQYSEKGFDFFTNYISKKGKHLEKHRFASLLFFWPELQRQVRIEGKVERLSGKESDEYFLKRTLESRISAWASPQSTVIPNRQALIDWCEEFNSIFKDTSPKRPSNWGGYRLMPDLFEFWQGRLHRLHDRIEYNKEKDGWKFHRLAP